MLLANGVEPLEMSAFTDVLGWATILGDKEITLTTVGLRKEIKSTFGLNLIMDKLVSDVDLNMFDALAIPGGFEPSGFYEESLSEPFLEVIRHFANKQKMVASVCVASISLGHAGVLTNQKATTYHQIGGKRKAQLEATGALFVDQPVVVSSNLMVTSTGPGSAIEVAFKLLEHLTSIENAANVKSKMRIPVPTKDWYQPQVVDDSKK